MAAEDVRRATTRISHEIVEKQAGHRGPRPRRDPAPRRAARPPHRAGDPRARGRGDPGRRARHHLLPRRPVARRPAAGRQGHADPVRPQRAHGRARGRRPVHGPHDPGRDGRAHRLRAAAGDPPRGPRRPRVTASCRSGPTTSARTCRPRARRSSTSSSRRSTARTRSRSSGCRSSSRSWTPRDDDRGRPPRGGVPGVRPLVAPPPPRRRRPVAAPTSTSSCARPTRCTPCSGGRSRRCRPSAARA